MTRACPGLLTLALLLCTACAPEVAPPAPKPALSVPAKPAAVTKPADSSTPAPPGPDLRGWWMRPEALASLGLTAVEGAALAPELNRLEQSYQTAQRQLPTVKDTQMRMLQDPKVPSADVRRFNRQNLQWLLTTMADQNLAARLWVREHLSAAQSARILARSPRFFAKRWFRAAALANTHWEHGSSEQP